MDECRIFFYIIKHFIKHASASKENTALLIFENHESHLSLEALALAKASGVTDDRYYYNFYNYSYNCYRYSDKRSSSTKKAKGAKKVKQHLFTETKRCKKDVQITRDSD